MRLHCSGDGILLRFNGVSQEMSIMTDISTGYVGSTNQRRGIAAFHTGRFTTQESQHKKDERESLEQN